MNRAQKIQLESWLRLRANEASSLSEFVKAQPPIWWISGLALFVLWGFAEWIGWSSFALRALVVAGVFTNFTLFLRFKLYWPLMAQCMDWAKVEQLLKGELDA